MNKLQYQYCCIDCRSSDMHEELMYILDNAREITYRTFRKYINVKEANKRHLIPLHKDWHVTFHKSKNLEGKTVYFYTHSRIEYIYY